MFLDLRLRLALLTVLLLAAATGSFSCGVKGPPLPPMAATPEQSESFRGSAPSPTIAPSPGASPYSP